MPVVPSPPTISSGIVTTSQYNQYRDAINFLLRPPAFKLRQSAIQSLTSGAWTALTFDAEDTDTDIDAVGGHDTAANNTRFTARYACYYQLGFMPNFAASATGQRGGRFAINGVTVTGSESFINATSAGGPELPASTTIVFLAIGDYVEAQALQNSGGALNTSANSTLHGVWESQ